VEFQYLARARLLATLLPLEVFPANRNQTNKKQQKNNKQKKKTTGKV
jgi:hypothetical protein